MKFKILNFEKFSKSKVEKILTRGRPYMKAFSVSGLLNFDEIILKKLFEIFCQKLKYF